MNASAGVPFVALYALKIDFAYSSSVIQILLQHFNCQTVQTDPVFQKTYFLSVLIYQFFAKIQLSADHPQFIQILILLVAVVLSILSTYSISWRFFFLISSSSARD
jgi:hypothetical protein